ncbi:hypothetical protein SISNIDRAFT_452275 [Sistotremastrum niveocremeum HHB9708]|uniref:Uncharacterized protein n=1 Tax=Sistotremastrum niveocremeum HHB9708 TaxID=1314777 RepID=A0A164X4L8_9AGAM|nr:hypothetical protein SISNIDRAFT_452275 [Sistotremastrum niveocremeum HHB9708]
MILGLRIVSDVALGGELKVEADGKTLKWTLGDLFGAGDAHGHVGEGTFISNIGTANNSQFTAGSFELSINGTHAELVLSDHTGIVGTYSGEGQQHGLDGHYNGGYKRGKKPGPY